MRNFQPSIIKYYSNKVWILLGNAFYGGNSKGLWALKIIDAPWENTRTRRDEMSDQSGTLKGSVIKYHRAVV